MHQSNLKLPFAKKTTTRANSCTRELQLKVNYYGPDHVQVFWKHMCFENISQLETRPSKTLAHDPALRYLKK